MPYKLDWIVPQRVLFGRMWGDPIPDEIRAFSLAIDREVAAGQPPVHVIIDVTAVKRTPVKLNELNSYLSRDNLAFFGWFIVVSGDPVGRFLGATVIQLVGLHTRVFPDSAAAFRFLSSIDSTLPDLTAIDSAL